MPLLFILICSLSIGSQTLQNPETAHAFSDQTIQQGASGDDVIELQSRLEYIGFYDGEIDGVFGWGTYWALRNFQDDFGMKVDGLAGSKVRQKLENASKYDKQAVKEKISNENKGTNNGEASDEEQSSESTNPTPSAVNVPQGYSQNDIKLISNAVYGESRGESYVGMVAVAAVILNRVESDNFPNSISGVIFEPLAFTAVADGQIWLTPDETAKEAVIDALNGWDPSGNAEYYFNPDTATSEWIWSRPQIKKIGKHIFAK